MIEIRIHGRGGQGAVTFAELLAKAAGLEGKWVQAFPAFGVERRGAPVKAFCRIDSKPITIRSQIYAPDWIVLLDSGLLDNSEVREGLKESTKFVINGNCSMEGYESRTIDATDLALKILGKPIVNTAMLGAFAKVSGLVELGSIFKALEENFSGKELELNRQLVQEAYQKI
jgi:pyruvate ferredoxin oxidoreductase gamma subunit